MNRKITNLACQAILILFTLVGEQVLETEVGFGSNRSVNEDVEKVTITISRTGDLNKTTAVLVAELWGDSRTTLEHSDISYNHSWTPAGTSSFSSSYSTLVTFFPGVKLVEPLLHTINVAQDSSEEDTERLYFNIIEAGNDSIGDGSLYIRVYDDEPTPVPILDVFNDDVDESETARVRIHTTSIVDYPISFKVHTLRGSANTQSINDDYNGFTSKSVTIRANDDDEYVSIQTYQNTGPNESTNQPPPLKGVA